MAAYYITIGFKVDFFSITHFCKTHVRKPRCERDRGKRFNNIKKFPLWKITFIKTLTQLDIKFAIDKYSTD